MTSGADAARRGARAIIARCRAPLMGSRMPAGPHVRQATLPVRVKVCNMRHSADLIQRRWEENLHHDERNLREAELCAMRAS